MSYDEILVGPEDDDEIDPELMAVAERRLAELESGLVKPVPAEQVHARVKARLRAARPVPALAKELVESLGPDDDEIDPELMAIWERRINEVESGVAKTIPVEESIARARAALHDARRNSHRG
jgi:Putative addiction module component